MSQPTEAIAVFPTEDEAQEALAWLREEGIEGSLDRDAADTSNYPILGGPAHVPMRVLVAASDAERARAVLASRGQDQLEPNWEEQAEAAIQGWICPNCDTEVNPDVAFCPECGASRTEVRVEDEDKGEGKG